ncbi:sugar ABC transporter ATP-binding protein [Halanaerobium congolense]|jgi:rhamnose transport system ATP-binding protein|uniref:Monosaccharide ABC transporter ATP-binding protein (CUT2 family) n=1 Tax=Halanaerobium congolense TaxID=54121 RepID=A0A1G6KI52_9FIRM|nr:sugar ABC transporter ATP-binding protein [Halanaerobium congolense]PXV62552.1 monosaccharide ABC transporter ATP-binding protein (CUT2 family) [Halanaerobium congolense]SDC30644.1 monosaccharide ABC transporter ATP-binding protein, CUT2 family [Halanaerobium congolense]
MSDKYILELKNITKKFPGVTALNEVSFQLKSGEIHALMGENGAGKSTFIKVITGVHQPNGGEIFLNGEKVEISNPNIAKDLGIAAIYQHATSYPHLSVTENIFMGNEKIDSKTKRILWDDMHKSAKKHLNELGADFDPRRKMNTLSVARQQIVEIAKAVSTNAEIIIMDEPTASLTKTESEDLYRITKNLQKIGTSIIFISHRFEDMYRLGDRVTVLRDANYIGTWKVNQVSNKDLIKAMVGRDISQMFPEKEAKIGKEVMRVENLSRKGFFKDISFSVKQGEILAITGLVGAGRTELCEALFGITNYDSGQIYFEGQPVEIKEVNDAMDLGIGYLPEDRQEEGLILDWELDKNISLSALDKISKNGWINRKTEKKMAKNLAEKVNVKARSIFNLAKELSGGNQQKLVVAKLLTSDLKVIILDEPTKGVDVGAKAAIFKIMNELAAQNYAIIMVSSEMPEVIGMGDRILVMRTGKVTAELTAEEADQEKILEAAMKEENI